LAPATLLKVILIAEHIISEPSGRAQIIGFLGVSPWATIGIPDPYRPIPSLSFMCLSGDPIETGQYVIEMRVSDPSGSPLASPPFRQTLAAARRAPLGAIFQIGMFPLNGVGKYTLQFFINDNPDLVGAFTITQGPMPAIR
jgi:hypothetical protein